VFWGWRQKLAKVGLPGRTVGPHVGHSSILSPLQKLQELRARQVAVSNLGTLRDDDTEEAWWESPKQAEPQGNWEQMAVQVSSVVPVSLALLHIPEGAFG